MAHLPHLRMNELIQGLKTDYGNMNLENYKLSLLQNGDEDALFRLVEKNRDRLLKYFPRTTESCKDLKSTRSYVAQKTQDIQKKDWFGFLIFDLQDQLRGVFILKNIDWRIPSCEMAYFIDRDVEGQGIISKVCRKMTDYCFKDLKMEKLFIQTGMDNPGSRKIALKNGFKQEGRLRNAWRTSEGELIDLLYFGLIRADWQIL